MDYCSRVFSNHCCYLNLADEKIFNSQSLRLLPAIFIATVAMNERGGELLAMYRESLPSSAVMAAPVQ